MQHISQVKLQEDGTLYFAAEAAPRDGKQVGRFMECIVEYDADDDKFKLWANDSPLVEF